MDQMSMNYFIAIITDVGMWVTPARLLHESPRQYFRSYPYLNIRQTTRFAQLNLKCTVSLKTEKRPILTTNRFSLQAGIKPP